MCGAEGHVYGDTNTIGQFTVAPAGIDIVIDKQTHVTVTGIDRQLVGQVAANIRLMRKPDPYKQKGVRYMGEVLKKKVGKTGA